MQDCYVGDIGDFATHALMREVSAGTAGKWLEVAWYLYPDQVSSGDGRHTRRLNQPIAWFGLSYSPTPP